MTERDTNPPAERPFDLSDAERPLWCQRCQGWYTSDHTYPDKDADARSGLHRTGYEYGPYGELLQTKLDYEKLLNNIGELIPESYDGDGSMQEAVMEWVKDATSGNASRISRATTGKGYMPVFVLKAQDRLAPSAIAYYGSRCSHNNLQEQAREVKKALNEFNEWQELHDQDLKMPDHKHEPIA